MEQQLNKREMNYFMQNHQLREEHKNDYPDGVYTLELIRDGKRFATTRGEALGEVGENVILFNLDVPEMEEVVVKITNVKTLSGRTPEQAEAWSKKEGWSVEFYVSNDNLNLSIQTSFELVI